MEAECLLIGAADFIVKPFMPHVVKSRISKTLELDELRNDLERKLLEKSRLVEKVTLNSIMAIANTIDAKDTYTSGHSVRVAKAAEEIAKRLGWNEEEIHNLHYVALLHDIGKIGVPDAILNKPSKLCNEEFAIIKKHPMIGNEILKDIHMIRHVAEGALYHHERYDGKGYPYGLKGEEIPLYGRIIGVADAYDAMTSNRVYRPKLKTKQVIAEFERGKGTQFDPQLADLMIQMLKEGFTVSDERQEMEASDNIAEESSRLLGKVLNEYTAEAKNSSMTDSLTGLFNRAYASDQIGRLLREGHTGALLAIDIDNFKRINDTYGHLAGDNTLRQLAWTLLESVEIQDLVCRIGGDEFVVFLTDDTVRDSITARIQALTAALTDCLTQLGYNHISSVSIGISVYPYDGKDYDVLYNNADKSLYYVKKNGKNAFYFYSDEIREEKKSAISTDLDNIRYVIEGRMGPEKGAFQVEYAEFGKIYSYISRGVRRNHQEVQILLFTLSSTQMARYTDIIPEEAMDALKTAVSCSLRMVDVGSRYSNVQYVVILIDTNIENGAVVAQRVIERFYKIYSRGDVSLTYDIQTMHSRAE
jgi:diguanylate cyclase (GGDEF)-like protein